MTIIDGICFGILFATIWFLFEIIEKDGFKQTSSNIKFGLKLIKFYHDNDSLITSGIIWFAIVINPIYLLIRLGVEYGN